MAQGHLGIEAKTLEIRAIEVTSNAIGDAPMLPELLAQIPADEPIESVCADGAYGTRGCLDAVAERQAMAVIPPRKNTTHWKKANAGSAQRNETVRAYKRLGSSICKKWSGYHRRGLVETKMHCFKRLGERVTARTFDRQVVPLHVRVALLNRFSQIGRPQPCRLLQWHRSVRGWDHAVRNSICAIELRDIVRRVEDLPSVGTRCERLHLRPMPKPFPASTGLDLDR